MATWTGYTRSTKGEYDAIYECYCTTCKGENLNTKALFYCKDCSQLFCDPCKKYHNKFTREHRVLGIDDVAKWGDVKPLRSSLMCDDHPGKELEMFCDDHDHVCCSICIGIKHRYFFCLISNSYARAHWFISHSKFKFKKTKLRFYLYIFFFKNCWWKPAYRTFRILFWIIIIIFKCFASLF